MEHEAGEYDKMQPGDRFEHVCIVVDQTTEARGPGEGVLDHQGPEPPPWPEPRSPLVVADL